VSLDKARRLLWRSSKSTAGNSLGRPEILQVTLHWSRWIQDLRFAGGREDIWEPEEDIFVGLRSTWLGDER